MSAAPAPAWRHPRWHYDEASSPAAQRSAARMAARQAARGHHAARGTSRPAVRAAVPATEAVVRPRTRPLLVTRPAPRARMSACLQVAALIVLAGVMVMVPVRLNTAAVEAEVESARLEQREVDLLAERSSLQARAAALSSLDRVQRFAQELGMVDAVDFAYLDLGGPAPTEVAAGTTFGQPRRR